MLTRDSLGVRRSCQRTNSYCSATERLQVQNWHPGVLRLTWFDSREEAQHLLQHQAVGCGLGHRWVGGTQGPHAVGSWGRHVDWPTPPQMGRQTTEGRSVKSAEFAYCTV